MSLSYLDSKFVGFGKILEINNSTNDVGRLRTATCIWSLGWWGASSETGLIKAGFGLEGSIVEKNYGKPQQPRSRIEIIADILRLLRLRDTGKAQITNYAKLNWDQGSKYINNLIESGFLEEAEEEMGLPCYRITKKGLKALSLVENLKEMFPPEGTLDILHRSKILEINVGHVLVTKDVISLARENQEFAIFLENSLEQYRKGNWGEKSDEANRLNTHSLERNMRLFSSYESKGFPEIWITTEPDRSYTTISFPDEAVSMEPLEDYQPAGNLEIEVVKDE